jgi:cleavage and polyadenylation specificity factor subunit 3
MSQSTVTQRQSICWTGAPNSIKLLLDRVGGPGTVEILEVDKKFKIFKSIELTFDGKIVIIEWQATPVSDMYADTVLASLLQSELCGDTIKGTTATKPDRMHFKECLIENLQDMFGEESVPKLFKGESLTVTVNGRKAEINLSTLVSKKGSF